MCTYMHDFQKLPYYMLIGACVINRANMINYRQPKMFLLSLQLKSLNMSDFINQETFKLRDVTEDAKLIIKCVRDLTSGRKADYTLIHFIEIFKGICK